MGPSRRKRGRRWERRKRRRPRTRPTRAPEASARRSASRGQRRRGRRPQGPRRPQNGPNHEHRCGRRACRPACMCSLARARSTCAGLAAAGSPRALRGARGTFLHGTPDWTTDRARAHRKASEDRSARSPRRIAEALDDPRAGRAAEDRPAGPRRRRAANGDAPRAKLRLARRVPQGVRRHVARHANRGVSPANCVRARRGRRARERALHGGPLRADAAHAARPQAHDRGRERPRGAARGAGEAGHRVERHHLRHPQRLTRALARDGRAGRRVQGARRRGLRSRGRGVRPPGQASQGGLSARSRQQHQRDDPRGRGLRSRVDCPGDPRLWRAPHRPRLPPARERRSASLRQRPPHPARVLPLLERADGRHSRSRRATRSSST